MGLSSSWLAIKGCKTEAVLEILGFEIDPGPHRKPPRVAMSELPNGWLTILYPRDLEAAFKTDLTALSADGAVIACALEEHVMYSEAREYVRGVETWRVVHNAEEEQGILHLDVTGAPPTGFEKVRAKTFADQAKADADEADDGGVDLIFDLPAEAAKLVCDYKIGDDAFSKVPVQPLRRAPGSGLLARLFKRR